MGDRDPHREFIDAMLRQMAKAIEGKGANVVGQFKFRGPEPNNKFASFAASLS